MSNDTKILLTIYLEGGILVRQGEVVKIPYKVTKRDQEPEKHWKKGEGYEIVKSGSIPHKNLTSIDCQKKIGLPWQAWAYFTDPRAIPDNFEKRNPKRIKLWKNLPEDQKISFHCALICAQNKGKGFKFEVITD